MGGELDRVRTALADRYAIERELGAGGMATVWLAHDLKHDRPVALKVLRPELSAALGTERFLREIRIAATLNHPHILPLLDSGDAEGLLFYVMPYVEGGSLRQRMRRDEPLALDLAVQLASQVAAALEHAHHHGIIHRDVKPENILISEGQAVVADFGIARAVTSLPGQESLTRTGFAVGTPGYMSPEQAAGTARLDARTDVFGLASVVYEMLVGSTPEFWATEQAVRLGRFVDASAAHRERLDRLPGRAQQALVRALAVRPADRFPTPVAFADALAAAALRSPALSDEQVHLVLRRAAELQLAQPTAEPALSVGAVEQIAAEVGIPPEHVRAAIREQGAGSRPFVGVVQEAVQRRRWRVFDRPERLGAEFGFEYANERVRVVRAVAGEVTSDVFPLLVEEIQETLGLTGHTSVVGQSLTWSPAAPGPSGRQVLVSVAAFGGRTEIRVEEAVGLAGPLAVAPAFGGAGGGLLGMMLGAIMAGGPHPAMLVFAVLLAFGGALGTARGLIMTRVAQRGPGLAVLADRLAVLVSGGVVVSGGRSAG